MPPSRRSVLLLPLLALGGCPSRARRDDKSSVSRVISLSPATTEAVFALSRGDRLVGRSRFCDFPPAAKERPSVGGFVDASFEAVLGLSPDLVIGVQGPGGQTLVERLEARGVATYFPSTDSFEEIGKMILGLGERLEASPAAAALVARVQSQRDGVTKKLASAKRPRALLVFGLRPIVAAGRGGFPDEMLRLAGADNAVSAKRYPTLGVEQVLAMDPDVVLDATGAAGHDGDELGAGLPGWRELRAVKAGRLLPLRDDRVLRPGPRVGEGLQVLARALHPEVAW